MIEYVIQVVVGFVTGFQIWLSIEKSWLGDGRNCCQRVGRGDFRFQRSGTFRDDEVRQDGEAWHFVTTVTENIRHRFERLHQGIVLSMTVWTTVNIPYRSRLRRKVVSLACRVFFWFRDNRSEGIDVRREGSGTGTFLRILHVFVVVVSFQGRDVVEIQTEIIGCRVVVVIVVIINNIFIFRIVFFFGGGAFIGLYLGGRCLVNGLRRNVGFHHFRVCAVSALCSTVRQS